MPYINRGNRTIFDKEIDNLVDCLIFLDNDQLCGNFNYIIFRMAKLLCDPKHNKMNYARINTIIGALESAKAEFQRRIVAPYEDEKISVNGDV